MGTETVAGGYDDVPAASVPLKYMAIDQGCTAHDLMVDGINDLFMKNGKPPIA